MALCSGNPPVTGQRWIPNTKDQSNNANLRWLLYCHIEQTVECPVKWDAFALMWRHLNATGTRSNESQQNAWWRHQMETFFALLALCAGNSPVPVNSPHKGQWRRALMFLFDLLLNKRLSKQPWGWWFETPPWLLWRQCNGDPWANAWDVIDERRFTYVET